MAVHGLELQACRLEVQQKLAKAVQKDQGPAKPEQIWSIKFIKCNFFPLQYFFRNLPVEDWPFLIFDAAKTVYSHCF